MPEEKLQGGGGLPGPDWVKTRYIKCTVSVAYVYVRFVTHHYFFFTFRRCGDKMTNPLQKMIKIKVD